MRQVAFTWFARYQRPLLAASYAAALLACRGAGAQKTRVAWIERPPALKPLPVAVGGRAVVNDTTGAKDGFGGKVYVYQWPGTHFAAAFAGPEVYFRLGPRNKQVLHVTVDGRVPVVLVSPREGNYRVAGLGAGTHHVRVEVVTENQMMPSVFAGFAIPVTERALAFTPAKRQMELIGDSHTLGFGVASPTRECSRDDVLLATDVERTAGVLAAEHYGADYRVVAISGRGLVRNFNGGPGELIPAVYPYVLEQGPAVDAVTKAWQPGIVVLALGTNDFGGALHPGERWKTEDDLRTEFETAYARFIGTLRGRYPGAYFILWATDTLNGELQAEAQKVVARLKSAGESRVAFVPVNGLSMSACAYHPSLADNQLIYKKLVSFIDAHPQLWGGE